MALAEKEQFGLQGQINPFALFLPEIMTHVTYSITKNNLQIIILCKLLVSR